MQDTNAAARRQHNDAPCTGRRLYLSRRSPSARADLSSDKERLGVCFLAVARLLNYGACQIVVLL